MVKACGVCAGCRVRETLNVVHSSTVLAILDFFARKGEPTSPTWKTGAGRF